MNEFITKYRSRIPNINIPSWAKKPQNLIIGVVAVLAVFTFAFLFFNRGSDSVADKPTIKILVMVL